MSLSKASNAADDLDFDESYQYKPDDFLANLRNGIFPTAPGQDIVDSLDNSVTDLDATDDKKDTHDLHDTHNVHDTPNAPNAPNTPTVADARTAGKDSLLGMTISVTPDAVQIYDQYGRVIDGGQNGPVQNGPVQNGLMQNSPGQSQKTRRPKQLSRNALIKTNTTKGLSGLTNMGNTCFANSIIQALSNTPTFMAYFSIRNSTIREELKRRIVDRMYEEEESRREKEGKIDEMNTSIDIDLLVIDIESKQTVSYNLGNLFRHMWAINCEVKPVGFRRMVGKHIPAFNGYSQSDAQEFLTALLDRIDEETKGLCHTDIEYTKEQSELRDAIAEIRAEYKRNMAIVRNLQGKKQRIEESLRQIDLDLVDPTAAIYGESYVDENKVQRDSYARQLTTIDPQLAAKTELTKNCIADINRALQADPIDFMRVESYTAYERLFGKSYSIINDIFSGLNISTVTCKQCQMVSFIFERFDILALNLPDSEYVPGKSYSLAEVLNYYIRGEELSGTNKFNCGYCAAQTDAVKKIQLYNTPDKLAIMIKKYQIVPKDDRFPKHAQGKIVKTSTKIEYPMELDLAPHLSEYIDRSESCKYRLYASVRHSGALESGHYYTYARSPLNDQWYCFDDGDVYWVQEEEALKSNGYILFYERVHDEISDDYSDDSDDSDDSDGSDTIEIPKEAENTGTAKVVEAEETVAQDDQQS